MSGDVLFIEDICRELCISRTTVERLRRHGAFPIGEMPALDKRPRWLRSKVEEFKASEQVHGNSIRRGRGFRHLKKVERVG